MFSAHKTKQISTIGTEVEDYIHNLPFISILLAGILGLAMLLITAMSLLIGKTKHLQQE